MSRRNVIRVKPVSFETDWQTDMKAVGVKVPKTVPETRYTPVAHHPIPYSLEVDLNARKVVRQITGVMPNALYNGKIYSWDEFRALLEMSPEEQAAVTSNAVYGKRVFTYAEFCALPDNHLTDRTDASLPPEGQSGDGSEQGP